MTIIRGSTHLLQVIKEATFGTTPATPAMTEIPITNFTKKSSQTVIRSDQIRSHPFVDRMMYGRFVHEIGVDFELQSANHDILLETVFGAAISAKSVAYTDALKGLSMESSAGGGSSKFDQFTGTYLSKISVSAAANDTSPVKVSTSGMAKTGTLDATSTLANSTVAATFVDPFLWADATLTIAAVSTAVASGSFDIDRAVDPLMLWGSRTPREFVQGAVTITGKITVPYDDGVQSALVTAFADNQLIFTFNNVGATVFRKFTFPHCKMTDIGRQINTRGGIMQELGFEAYYDSGTTTAGTLTTQ